MCLFLLFKQAEGTALQFFLSDAPVHNHRHIYQRTGKFIVPCSSFLLSLPENVVSLDLETI